MKYSIDIVIICIFYHISLLIIFNILFIYYFIYLFIIILIFFIITIVVYIECISCFIKLRFRLFIFYILL